MYGGIMLSYLCFKEQNSDLQHVLQITKNLVVYNEYKEKIHIISANSCNIIRVLCEIPILFYSYFHSVLSTSSMLTVSTHVANLKTLYSLCVCKEMNLPIEKILVGCHPGSRVEDLITKGSYQRQAYFSHSNLERYFLIFL